MIKSQTILAIAARLVIVLGMQDYMIFMLNDRINQLSRRNYQIGSAQIKDNELFNDHTWNRYQKTQRMQK